ncbi:MAG: hypothetical protein AB1938_03915 [Myxococcota bacterium]
MLLRLLLLCALAAAAAGLFACGTTAPVCTPGSCPVGQHCVFVGAATAPACTPSCENVDAGTCASGTSCGCAASCQGCKNCVLVCQ